jgi:hypothetical protein
MSAPALPQIGIAVLGLTAIFLTQSRHAGRRKWACILGLGGQPFWFWATGAAEQWGMFALCFLYTWAWGKGVWVHWIKPEKYNA